MQARRNEGPSGAAPDGGTSNYRQASRTERALRQTPYNLWGLAGRQETMEMRRLWQLRIPRPRHPRH
jgi:hypothetical protein